MDAHKLDLEGQGIISNLDILKTYCVSDLKFGSDIHNQPLLSIRKILKVVNEILKNFIFPIC